MPAFEPDYVDHYECGNVELRVYVYEEDPEKTTYWLKVGAGALMLREGEFNALLEIMDQYYDENMEEDDGE